MYKNTPILSTRERRIIELMAEGCTAETIGNQMNLSTSEVQQRIQKMLQKQGFESTYQLISWAFREAIIT
ncbi:response regulator transcription factor [Pontibacter sp. KCTC 32443]|uniref:response regulator transcription factor n=1 Tax=Pontibacter TaxID=323449 RepID=UPI00164D7088|nr:MULTISPECIES: LuxR C-terminal-related transcriptional regulator [Pontibacter]MBC5774745.1 response regulator transcription factor [Pontibacter sp. KCTC 32443]